MVLLMAMIRIFEYLSARLCELFYFWKTRDTPAQAILFLH